MIKLVVILLIAVAVPLDLIDFPVKIVYANPIPVPSIMMPYEYITADVIVRNGTTLVKVEGTYIFVSFFRNVSMSYPIPPNSTQVVVKMDGDEISYSYSSKIYPTILGDFQFINWTLAVPDSGGFAIEVDYEHLLPEIEGNYTFLYAMGTGKYWELYDKSTTAYVTVNIDMEISNEETLDMKTYLIKQDSESTEWIWKLVEENLISEKNGLFTISSRFTSSFEPMAEDYLLTFRKAQIRTVNVPTDYQMIQAALEAANPRDTVLVHEGVYSEQIIIRKPLKLVGCDPTEAIIDGNGSRNVILLAASNVYISGFTIRNSGFAPQGYFGYCGIKISQVVFRSIDVYSCMNSIRNNMIVNNNYGIHIYSNDDKKPNFISENLIANNTVGMLVNVCNGCMIAGNTFSNNEVGVEISASNRNIFYHNNFVNNTDKQVVISNSFGNIWDNRAEGNFWSDYVDEDLNQDGIGDTAYIIDDDTDRYPLMGMFHNFTAKTEEGKTYSVEVISNRTISAIYIAIWLSSPSQSLKTGQDFILIEVSGGKQSEGFCRIGFSRTILDSTYAVFIDGIEVPAKELSTSNNTDVCLYFAFQGLEGLQRIIIVPEFQSTVLLLFLAIFFTLIILVTKKKSQYHRIL